MGTFICGEIAFPLPDILYALRDQLDLAHLPRYSLFIHCAPPSDSFEL